MAFFVAGGNLGFGSGPLLAITFVGLFGLERTWLTAVAGIAVGVFLFVSVPRSDSRPAEDTGPYEGLQVLAWLAPMLTLYLVVTLRAAAAITFTTFVPLLCERRGEPLALGGFTLLGFSLAGAVGGIAGGLAVRRLQQRWVTAVTLALAAGCFLVFLRADGVAAAVMALALGACLFAALPVNIVMAQQLLPRHATAASGLVMGAAWAVGSFSATGVGALADFLARSAPAAAALGRAMEWSVLLLLVAAALACLLPELEARDT
jgi:FSR family fosmidomycin resistance protein-like MFS transporter